MNKCSFRCIQQHIVDTVIAVRAMVDASTRDTGQIWR